MDSEFRMRASCIKCGNDGGMVVTRGGQDCVYCGKCGRFQYNAPKTETGRKVRSLKTTHELITPSIRWKVIERANGTCESCRRRPPPDVGLQVGHVVSVDDGHRHGLTDYQINSIENLIAQCPECNSGASSRTIPIWMLMAILKSRIESS